LKSEIFLGIRDRQIPGFHGIHLLRRNLQNEVEFVTVMWFDSIESVKIFAGEEHEIAVVPPKARALLSRFDERSQHYEVRSKIET
jgi:heme-degrading monooxygenase HmoA